MYIRICSPGASTQFIGLLLAVYDRQHCFAVNPNQIRHAVAFVLHNLRIILKVGYHILRPFKLKVA